MLKLPRETLERKANLVQKNLVLAWRTLQPKSTSNPLHLRSIPDAPPHSGEHQGPAVPLLRARGGGRRVFIATSAARLAQCHLYLSGN